MTARAANVVAAAEEATGLVAVDWVRGGEGGDHGWE